MLSFSEPVKKLFNQGMVYGPGGEKMSKSKGNVVLPEQVSEKYGIDSARLFLISSGSLDKNRDWSDEGVEGSMRFINRVIEYVSNYRKGKSSRKAEHKINKAIKEITEDIGQFRYNLALIKLRGLFDSFDSEIGKKDLESFLKLFSVFCPHVAEELWEKLGNKKFVSLSEWPVADDKKINDEFDKKDRAVDRVVSDILNVLKILKERGNEGEKIYLYVLPSEKEIYSSEELTKRVGKEFEVFSVNDKNKYDPEKKSSKARPGKPGIFVE